MIEMLIAIGIAVLIILAFVQTMVASIKNAQFAKYQNLATRYSQQGVEMVRSQRDLLGWQTFYSTYNGTSKCLATADPASWTDKGVGCSVNIDNLFTREAVFTDAGGGVSELVIVTTFWTDNSGIHKSEQRTYLSSW